MTPEMITRGRERPRGKSVMLFSGGLDSLCAAYLMNPDILLYVPTASTYMGAETNALSRLMAHRYVDATKLIETGNVLKLDRYERDDMIVPNRNAHLVLLASHYGETIYLCAINGDRPHDKDPHFVELMTDLLNHMWQESPWCEGRLFNIRLPFKIRTKTSLVRAYLHEGGPPAALLISYSCYTGNTKPCGTCKTCFRKWVALYNNGVAMPEDYFAQHPMTADWLEKLVPAVVSRTYRGDEDDDWRNAIEKYGKQHSASVDIDGPQGL